MEKEQAAQEESKKEEASNSSKNDDTYNEYYKLTDVVVEAALDELKIRSIDRRSAQDAKIRQLIYLCITLCAAIGTVITMTQYWGGPGAVLHATQPWQLFGLCVSFLLCVAGFIYGVWALKGENDGTVPIVEKYAQILRDGYGPDGSGKAYEATISWLQQTDEALDEYRDLISKKAKKIRTLNKLVLCAAVCAALVTAVLFASNLLENYVRQQAQALCAQATAEASSESPNK